MDFVSVSIMALVIAVLYPEYCTAVFAAWAVTLLAIGLVYLITWLCIERPWRRP